MKQISDLAEVDIKNIIDLSFDKIKSTEKIQSGTPIPLIPVKAAAGYQAGFPDTQHFNELPHLYIPVLERGDFRAFEISGDSMFPLALGTIVIGQRLENISKIKNGKTYILVTKSDGVLYKRVFNYIDDKGLLYLVSDNAQYKPHSVSPLEIVEIWVAKAYLSLEFPELEINSTFS